MKSDSVWMRKYRLAKAYYEHYGHLEVLKEFKTNNGYEYDKDGEALGFFIRDLRSAYNRGTLTSEKIELLKQIGMRFECKDYEKLWLRMYNLAKAYYEKHNDLNIPQRFKTTNGYEYDEDGLKLGSWITIQRVRYKKGKLSEDRIAKLKEMDMRFETIEFDINGEKHYELAKKYYEHYGNLEVSARFKTKNGVDYDEDGVNLGYWIRNQRSAYQENRLSEDRYELLKAIGMRFESNKRQIDWDMKYQLAKNYYEYYGNLKVQKDFKTSDGITYDEDGIELADWLGFQKNLNTSKKLSAKKRTLLEDIGMDFSLKDYTKDWLDMFNLARNFFEFYGNLEVLRDFTTSNGYDYDKNGKKLGKWINTQRCQYSKGILSQDKVDMLNSIGMVWNMQKKIEVIKNWCHQNMVDYDLNKKILSHISYQELVSKAIFLSSLKVNIVNKKGRLHKIFAMSNMNMQANYEISIEELIKKYYVMNEDKKLKRI